MQMEITFDKYYEAVIDEKSVSFTSDLNKYRRFKREFFETKQERKLQEIATKEFEDIQSGKRVNQKPEKVVWQPIRL